MSFFASILLAAITVGTWNGKWFPSGRAEHRAPEAQEALTIAKAGVLLRDGLAKADPAGTNDVILCLNEIRGPNTTEKLIGAIGRTNLAVAVVTRYRRRDRFDMQQDVILTTLPIVSANWSKWKNAKDKTPPRGYARANLLFAPSVTGTVYAIHLKSNYGQTSKKLADLNCSKRALAAKQIVEQERVSKKKKGNPVIVAGDINADKWAKQFSEDSVFAIFEEGGFLNVMDLIDPIARITYPGRGKWAGTTLDYIFHRGFKVVGKPFVLPAEEISDHNPVFVNLDCQ